ncbi:MAG TPA: hypothetical protein VNV63_05880 [Nitrospiria bacterium]|jgi:hypothetical protein|nr:hypothetical protein [Nitrospiria bacterium]
MNIFSRKTSAPSVAEVPVQVDPFNDPDDERCSNPRCSHFISAKHTPNAVVYCGRTFCEESCVPPSLRERDRIEKQQDRAFREKTQADAIALAKANRILTLRQQIAECKHFLEVAPGSAIATAQLREFEIALAAELEIGNTDPHHVIVPDRNQIVEHHGRGFTSFTGDSFHGEI